MSVSKLEVLRLYKNLIKYSKSLTLTDPVYFKKRVTTEFRRNKDLNDLDKITFAFQVCHQSTERRGTVTAWLCGINMLKFMKCLPAQRPIHLLIALKHTIDYSLVPKINETDLSEQFVRGGGPGGSAVNKNSNCVVLTHNPSGIVVKCHISRCQDDNRKMAREMLIAKLDEEINKDNSVAAQKKRLEEKKLKKNDYKKKKLAQLKNEWKKREGLV